jgi:lysozyme
MKPITKMSEEGRELLTLWEGGHVLTSYKDTANVWTIGVGVTRWGNGKKVEPFQQITAEESKVLFSNTLKAYEQAVYSTTRDDINQNQFDALVSFCYNIGINGFKNSTVLKRVNKNLNDPTIQDAFMMWVNINGVPANGLKNRRKKEWTLYAKV